MAERATSNDVMITIDGTPFGVSALNYNRAKVKAERHSGSHHQGAVDITVEIDVDSSEIQSFIDALRAEAEEEAHRMVFRQIVAIVATHAPADCPWAVVGQPVPEPGTIVVFFLKKPTLEEVNRFFDAVAPRLPAMWHVAYRWSRCIIHTDCEEHADLGRACWERSNG